MNKVRKELGQLLYAQRKNELTPFKGGYENHINTKMTTKVKYVLMKGD